MILTSPATQRQLGQWFTPAWAAAQLVERYFPDLGPGDLVIEPSCGHGSFLQALPDDVPAIGVELDPIIAAEAAARTGRRVIVGDFRTVELPPATAMIGNPPYEVRVIEAFLGRARQLLPEDGRCGFLLPAYALQTHQRVMRWHRHWSMTVEIAPRRLFPRLRLPLVWVMFRRAGAGRLYVGTLIGLTLYREACEVDNVSAAAREVLTEGRPRMGVWRALVQATLERLGGQAELAAIYHAIEPRRPTPNAHWREKVRQTLQRYFRPVERGVWALA